MRIQELTNLDRRLEFETNYHPAGGSNPFLPATIDEVRLQMSSQLQSIDATVSIQSAARVMCQKHVHHLVVLDGAKHPIEMLSALDILSHITGEPVLRKRHEDPDQQELDVQKIIAGLE